MNRIPALIVFIFIFSSCADHSKNVMPVFKAADESLSRSTKNMEHQSEYWYHMIVEKCQSPEDKDIAATWRPKAKFIREQSSAIIKYVEGLKDNLRNEAGVTEENRDEVLQRNNNDAVRQLFLTKKKAEELYEKLKSYVVSVLDFDPKIQTHFGEDSVIMFKDLEQGENNKRKFTEKYFGSLSVVAALTSLSTFENDIRILEDKLIEFCFNNIGHVDGYGMYDRLAFMIGQSSNKLIPGEDLEIIAGVGQFSMAAQPIITINGNVIPLNENATAVYKFKTTAKPGIYNLPVKVEYTNPDGTKKILTRSLKYTVAE